MTAFLKLKLQRGESLTTEQLQIVNATLDDATFREVKAEAAANGSAAVQGTLKFDQWGQAIGIEQDQETRALEDWTEAFVTARLGQLRCYDALGDFEKQLAEAEDLKAYLESTKLRDRIRSPAGTQEAQVKEVDKERTNENTTDYRQNTKRNAQKSMTNE